MQMEFEKIVFDNGDTIEVVDRKARTDNQTLTKDINFLKTEYKKLQDLNLTSFLETTEKFLKELGDLSELLDEINGEVI